MSAEDYFNAGRQQTPQPYQPYTGQHHNPHQDYDFEQRYGTPTGPPSYHTQAESQAPSREPTVPSIASPFEAPFDDHVYPASRPGPMDSQSTLGGDSRYYGQGGGGRQNSQTSFRDDIPLRDNPGAAKYDGGTDHVHDIPVGQSALEDTRPQRRSGMDFLKGSGKSFPWVVYTLTTIQFAVFFAEIAINGKHGMSGRRIMLTLLSQTYRISN
jgi:hypothetical protein